jgi:trimeric autotransporter adhesin
VHSWLQLMLWPCPRKGLLIMALLRAVRMRAARTDRRDGRPARAAGRARWRHSRRLTAVALGPVVAASTSLVPVAVAGAVTAGAAAAVVATAPPARASTLGSVLILSSSVNGGASSAEAAAATADGYTPVLESSSAWSGLSGASNEFSGYAAVIIGDPSTGGTCSSMPDSDAAGNESKWGPGISGNVAVLGTAPALAGTAGSALMRDAIAYAASGGAPGLYISLNCDYSAASNADSDASLLDGVSGGGFSVTGHVTGSGPACGDSGSVNTWEADASASFAGLAGSALSASSWGSACPVQETFNTWPANFTPVAYDAAATPADFAASDGTTGQPYVLLGTPAPSAATLAASGTTGGSVPRASTIGGSDPASHAVQAQATASPVNTESGDFTQSSTDMSIPGFGPPLGLSRSYDSQLAQQQEQTGTPGAMGYGWTDNWASSLSAHTPVPGDIYALDGLAGAANTGDGMTAYAASGQAPASSPLGYPGGVLVSGGNVYFSDTGGNRVEEIPATSGTQWGVAMTAGQAYTIAGGSTGGQGSGGDGGQANAATLSGPMGLAMDAAGDMLIADSGNWEVRQVTPAGVISTIAGEAQLGNTGDGGPAISAKLGIVTSVAVDSAGDLYIADSGNNRIQEVFKAGGSQWGQSMTAGDIYTVAGSASGTAGRSANGTTGGSSLLNRPDGITIDGSGDMYIADAGNNRVAEIPKSAGTNWGISMAGGDLYDVAGSAAGTAGHTGDGSSAYSTALLSGPQAVTLDSAGNMMISDTGNSRVQFVPKSSGTQWGQPVTLNDMYTIAGSSAGTAGNSGNGGAATGALLDAPAFAATFSSGKLWITDTANNTIRQVSASTYVISGSAGDGQTLASAGNGGPAINGELVRPGGEIADPQGDLYIADTANNRVQEIAASTHTQWGIPMTGGDVYTIAGSAAGQPGSAGNGGAATAALLNYPEGLAFDPSGNLLIVDQFNNQVREVSAATGKISVVAGNGTAGTGSDGVAATAGELSHPFGVAVDGKGDIYIADKVNNRIQEVFAAGGNSWGQSMTAGDVYTVAGSAAGTSGNSGAGGAATAALLNGPEGVSVDGAGNLYIADTQNEQVREVPVATAAQWNRNLTKNDIYTIAGSTAATKGSSGDGGPAASSLLHTPVSVATDIAGDLYIADGANDEVREIPAANGTQWATSMEYGDIYTIAGKAGTATNTGNGGPAFLATISFAMSNNADAYGDLYIGDWTSSQLREVISQTPATISPSPAVTYPSALYPPPGSTVNGTSYPGGITVTQPGGAQITFWPQASGGCTTPQVTAGGYCVGAPFSGATLTLAGNGLTYTYSPSPGSQTYTYSATTGQLTAVTDPAGNTVSQYYNTPAPGSATATSGTTQPVTSTAIICPATAHSCDTIVAASGRGLVLGLDATGQVTSVTDPLGRQSTYTYTGCTTATPGVCDLSTAKDPMTNSTSYTYDTSNTGPLLAADLLSITSPNAQPGGPDAGDATVNTYNTAGQLTTQTDPMGNKTTLAYCASAASQNCLNPATGNGNVTVTEADGNKTVYAYVDGTLASQTDWTAGSTTPTSETNTIPDTVIPATASPSCPGNTNGSLLAVASFDGNQNETTYCNNNNGNVTSTTAPSGGSTPSGTAITTTGYTAVAGNQGGEQNCTATAEATVTCAQDPGPAAVTAGGTITPPASAPALGLTYSLYDSAGNQLYSTTGVSSPSGSYEYSQTTYQLYKGNSITLNSTSISCTYMPPSVSLPCATINADGVVTQLQYNSQGDLALSSTPDGNSGGQLATTTYTDDSDGEQLTQVTPDGNVSGANAGNYTATTAWNKDSEQTSVTQGNGTGYTDTPRNTSYGYDGDGNQTTVMDARGYTNTIKFNADDKPALVTDPDGNATLTCYDGDGNTAQTVPPVGVAANSLTAASCPTAYPAGYSNRLATDATVSTFNAAGQRTLQTTPAPAGQSGYETTSYTYDGNGNVLTTTAPPAVNSGSNQVTASLYTAAGKLASQTTGSGTSAASTVSYCYNPDGQRTSTVYADGNTSGTAACSSGSPWTVGASPQVNYQTTYAYDSVGELVSTTTPKTTAAPSGGTTTSTYDAAGNMLTRKDPNGVTTTWTYTPLNLTATISYSGSSAHSVTDSYDASGNKTAMTDATGSSSFIYNSFGELTSADNGASQTTQYGYNADGQTSSITYPLPSTATWATSKTVSYGYDTADLLTSVTDLNGDQITIANTADGQPKSQALGSTGDTITAAYDNTDNPSAITLKNSNTTLQSFTYSDSPADTILSETDTPSSSQSPADYSYDAQGRVTSETPGTGSSKDYGFDASSDLTTLPNGATGIYDDAGELTSQTLSGTTTNYTYDADGEQLTSVQGSTTESSGTWSGAAELATFDNSGGDMTAATYDGDGVRASTTIIPSGGSAASQGYVWNTVPQVPQMIMDGANAYIYDGGLAPAEQVSLSVGTVTYLIKDSLGSVRGTVNSSGGLTATTSYDAWGTPETSGGLAAATPFGFAGGYTDPDGLVYLLNRYYLPSTGQFISVDPAIAQTLEPYEYGGDSPTSTSDPTGLWPFHVSWQWDGALLWFNKAATAFLSRFGLRIQNGLIIAMSVLGVFNVLDGELVDILVGLAEDDFSNLVQWARFARQHYPRGCVVMHIWYWGTAESRPYWGGYCH